MPAGLEGACPGPLWGPGGGGPGLGEARGSLREVGGVGGGTRGRAASPGPWEARCRGPGDVQRRAQVGRGSLRIPGGLRRRGRGRRCRLRVHGRGLWVPGRPRWTPRGTGGPSLRAGQGCCSR